MKWALKQDQYGIYFDCIRKSTFQRGWNFLKLYLVYPPPMYPLPTRAPNWLWDLPVIVNLIQDDDEQ
jgi:hypothetical protein